jgi:hypothetical protein
MSYRLCFFFQIKISLRIYIPSGAVVEFNIGDLNQTSLSPVPGYHCNLSNVILQLYSTFIATFLDSTIHGIQLFSNTLMSGNMDTEDRI